MRPTFGSAFCVVNREQEMLSGFLENFRKGLSKTREGVFNRIRDVVRGKPRLDEETLEEIEELLIRADTKPGTQWGLTGEFRKRLLARFEMDDIVIPFQHLTVYFGDRQDSPRSLPEAASPPAPPRAD